MTEKTVFETLNDIDVSSFTEDLEKGYGNNKKTFSYLSWANAWAEVKKRYPNISYEVKKFNNLPYVHDEATGYMVYTTVTINEVTHEMWLPVLDSSHRPMKSQPYQITFKKGNTVTVEAATMFDINKTIMRCLTKNLAMHGLGLYIYAGEDIPEAKKEELVKVQNDKQAIVNYAAQLKHLGEDMKLFYDYVANAEGVAKIKEVPNNKIIEYMKKELESKNKNKSIAEQPKEPKMAKNEKLEKALGKIEQQELEVARIWK